MQPGAGSGLWRQYRSFNSASPSRFAACVLICDLKKKKKIITQKNSDLLKNCTDKRSSSKVSSSNRLRMSVDAGSHPLGEISWTLDHEQGHPNPGKQTVFPIEKIPDNHTSPGISFQEIIPKAYATSLMLQKGRRIPTDTYPRVKREGIKSRHLEGCC